MSKHKRERLPSDEEIQKWVSAALSEDKLHSELSVRIVDDEESRDLNFQYRNKNKSTNVLSFPCELADEVNCPLLGDIVICAPIVIREAAEQGKEEHAHWAHMLVHGTLHLQGYDHTDEAEADIMESLETTILVTMGFDAPYE